MKLLALLLLSIASAITAAEPRPNILWITAEDMSPNLGCYGDKYATSLPAKDAITAARDDAKKRLKEDPCFLFIKFGADAALTNFNN